MSIACRLPAFALTFRNRTGGLLTFFLDSRFSLKASRLGPARCSHFVSTSAFRGQLPDSTGGLLTFASSSRFRAESFRKPDNEPRFQPARPERYLQTSAVHTKTFRNRTGGLLTLCLGFRLSRKTSGTAPADYSRVDSISALRANTRKPSKEPRFRPARPE